MTDDTLSPVEPSRWTASGDQHRVLRASNLRQEADIAAPIYATLTPGAIVNVVGEDGEWWHVEVHGWVAKTQVGASLDPARK